MSGRQEGLKDVQVRWIGRAKLPFSAGGLTRINAFGVMEIGPGWDSGRCRLDGSPSAL